MKVSSAELNEVNDLISEYLERNYSHLREDEFDASILLSAVQAVIPIEDPLILEAHVRFVQIMARSYAALDNDEYRHPAATMLHVWYKALGLHAASEGWQLPLLRRDRLERLLPQYLPVSVGEAVIALTEEETEMFRALNEFNKDEEEAEEEDPETENATLLLVYPLLIIKRLLEDARALKGRN